MCLKNLSKRKQSNDTIPITQFFMRYWDGISPITYLCYNLINTKSPTNIVAPYQFPILPMDPQFVVGVFAILVIT